MENADNNEKIPLPQFLKFLSNNNISVAKAMAIAGKMFVESLPFNSFHFDGLDLDIRSIIPPTPWPN